MMNTINIRYGPRIEYSLCNGCGKCYEMCPMDVFTWNNEKQLPEVTYPGECSICCFCEVVCPEVAIDVQIPLHHLLDFGISPLDVRKISSTFE